VSVRGQGTAAKPPVGNHFSHLHNPVPAPPAAGRGGDCGGRFATPSLF